MRAVCRRHESVGCANAEVRVHTPRDWQAALGAPSRVRSAKRKHPGRRSGQQSATHGQRARGSNPTYHSTAQRDATHLEHVVEALGADALDACPLLIHRHNLQASRRGGGSGGWQSVKAGDEQETALECRAQGNTHCLALQLTGELHSLNWQLIQFPNTFTQPAPTELARNLEPDSGASHTLTP